MVTDRPSAGAQRLALVFRGAGASWALPATTVLEVVPAPDAPGARTRSGLEVEDFATLFGRPAAARDARAVTLVLDCAPPRALLVEAVVEVADLAIAPFFGLPREVSAPLQALVRGALLHRGRLVLELEAQALAELEPGASRPLEEIRLGDCSSGWLPPERALLFEAGGSLFGVGLGLVTGVLRVEAACPLPLAPVGLSGLLHHERSVLPLYDLGRVAGLGPTAGGFAIALEVDGSAVGLAADAVLGVHEGFGDPEPAPGGVLRRARDGRPVLFPEIERWLPGLPARM